MKQFAKPVLLRIYTDEDALHGDQAIFAVIVARAREAKLAGSTVLRGRMGFGAASHLHAHRPFDLSDNLPMVVELVDEEDKLRAFLAALSDLAGIGLATFEKIEVARYGRPDV